MNPGDRIENAAGDYAVTLTDYGFRLDRTQPLRVLTVGGSGKPDPALARLAAKLSEAPVAACALQEGTTWDCDVQAGVQRWEGEKDTAVVRKTVVQHCGFTRAQWEEIYRYCRGRRGQSCPSFRD